VDKRTDALDRILDAIEKSIETAPVDDLRDELKAEGHEPSSIATQMRAVLTRVGKRHRQAKLDLARHEKAAALAAYEEHRPKLPNTPAQRRLLLQQTIARNPHLTLQFRDLDHHSDADVESALRDLAHLGLLPDEED
jgi:hypothetical protein